MKMILASNNAHKMSEMRAILADLGVELMSQRSAGCDFEVEETGTTFEENAYLKAIAVTQATGMPAIADDSGLEVDCLNGEPGVYSARYSGSHEHTDQQRNEYLLKKLEGVPLEQRTARFVSSICCTFPNGDVLRARGTMEGKIMFQPEGENGFGYDPLFLADGQTVTNGLLTPEQKNAISHRGKALRMLQEELRKYYVNQ